MENNTPNNVTTTTSTKSNRNFWFLALIMLVTAAFFGAQSRGWIQLGVNVTANKPVLMERYTLLTDSPDPKGVGEFVTVGSTHYLAVACTIAAAAKNIRAARERGSQRRRHRRS